MSGHLAIHNRACLAIQAADGSFLAMMYDFECELPLVLISEKWNDEHLKQELTACVKSFLEDTHIDSCELGSGAIERDLNHMTTAMVGRFKLSNKPDVKPIGEGSGYKWFPLDQIHKLPACQRNILERIPWD